MIKKCIICGKNKDENNFNIEHIIPEALGNKTLKIDSVCIQCNSKLGSKIDRYITECFIVKLIRNHYRIAGKSNKVPNPFKEGIDENGDKIRLDENFKPTIVSNAKQEGNLYKIKASSKKEAIEIVEKLFKKNKINMEQKEKIIEQVEIAKIESSKPKITYHYEINFDEMQLAIIKIAYEYTYLKLGKSYYYDDCAKELRRVLQEALENNKIQRCNLINCISEEIEEPIKCLVKEFNNSHFIQMQRVGSNIVLFISLFCTATLSYIITVSHNVSKYEKANFTNIVKINKS